MRSFARLGQVVDDTALTFGPRAVPLSVLDLAPVPDGGSAAQALRATIDLARQAERLGYHRFWVAEHHNMPGIASSAPPVLIGHIADATTTMRVGSGGVMLPNHVSLVVAEQFGMLEALHPGRIDLGIGRAPGTDQVTAAALRRSPEALSADDFPDQLMDLLGFFTGRWPEHHPFAQITAVPGRGNLPAMWLLGSSGYSAQVAGLLGLPFAFAHHFSAATRCPRWPCTASTSARRKSSTARTRWSPPPWCAPRPTSAPASWPAPARCRSCGCAPAGRPAALARGGGRLSLHRAGARVRRGPPGHPDRRPPETVQRGISDLLDAAKADELMITTMVYDPADRLSSFERVAALARATQAAASPVAP